MKVYRTQAAVLGLFAALFIVSCEDLNLPEGTPDCIEKRIKKFDRKGGCSTGATVVKYNFQGGTIYVFNPGNCGADFTAAVVDQDCNDLCTLGGFGGNVVCNGDTISEATNREVIWSN